MCTTENINNKKKNERENIVLYTQTHTTEFMLFQGLLRETPLSVRLGVCADAVGGRVQGPRQTYGTHQ